MDDTCPIDTYHCWHLWVAHLERETAEEVCCHCDARREERRPWHNVHGPYAPYAPGMERRRAQ